MAGRAEAELAAISRRFLLMMQQAAKAQDAKKEEGKVQVGMNFEKMMENRKFAAMENAQIFGTPQPQTFVSSHTPGRLFARMYDFLM